MSPLYYVVLLTLLQRTCIAQNFVVPWSTSKFGPDGPWQAVDITVGGNDSSKLIIAQSRADLTVYPGGDWTTLTFTPDACNGFRGSFCGAGGTWSPDPEQAAAQRIAYPATWIDNSTGVSVDDAQRVVLGLTINSKTVWNASLASASSRNVTYPNGVVSGVPMGYLALGADDPTQVFTLGSTAGSSINASIFAGKLYTDGEIASYSYGLHIGSAAFNYPGSLVFGGYNKGRVIGPVTAFSDRNAVDLIDITIGVAAGDSPFNFTSKDKLLSTGTTSITPDPLSPYISLPRQTCDNLASLLPVTFDPDLQYYLWNTEDRNFAKIVSSPAYLGFTFPPSPGTSENVIIKVPFALLNLTLEAPITNTPKQYFPCLPYEYTPKLGRAFLQAAFIGRNWGTKTSWLAQAPGPGVARKGLGDQNTDILKDATMIEGFTGADLFAESWKGQWSLIDSQTHTGGGGDGSQSSSGGGSGTGGNSSTNANLSSSSGLSEGAKAGIGVGALLGVIAVLQLLFFIWWKLSKKSKTPKPDPSTSATNANTAHFSEQPEHYSPGEKPPGDYYAHDDGQMVSPIFELPHTEAHPLEAPDTSVRGSTHEIGPRSPVNA